jgi:tripartite-type tricarboxylate transporter receptor subunit TctC
MLAPIALFAADPTVLVVPASSPIRTIEQFIAEVKSKPGQFSYSSAGNYSALHVPMAQLSQAAGLDMLHVPFQGGGPALTALLGGQVQCLASGPGPVAPHVRSGALRPLATWGRTRLAGLPEVPTLIEKGFPDCEFYIWVGLFAPAATPAPVIDAHPGSLRAGGAGPRIPARHGRIRQHARLSRRRCLPALLQRGRGAAVRTVRALGRIE